MQTRFLERNFRVLANGLGSAVGAVHHEERFGLLSNDAAKSGQHRISQFHLPRIRVGKLPNRNVGKNYPHFILINPRH